MNIEALCESRQAIQDSAHQRSVDVQEAWASAVAKAMAQFESMTLGDVMKELNLGTEDKMYSLREKVEDWVWDREYVHYQ
jgi:hypothetical protein